MAFITTGYNNVTFWRWNFRDDPIIVKEHKDIDDPYHDLIKVSASGRFVITCHDDIGMVWDMITGDKLNSINFPKSPFGNLDNVFKIRGLFDISDDRIAATTNCFERSGFESKTTIQFCRHDGNHTTTRDITICLSQRMAQRSHSGWLSDMVFSRDGNYIAVTNDTKETHICAVKHSALPVNIIKFTEDITSVRWLSDDFLAIGFNNTIEIYDVDTKSPHKVVSLPGYFDNFFYTSNEEKIVTYSDNCLFVWTKEGVSLGNVKLDRHALHVHDIKLSPSGKYAMVKFLDTRPCSLEFVNLETMKKDSLNIDLVTGFAFSPVDWEANERRNETALSVFGYGDTRLIDEEYIPREIWDRVMRMTSIDDWSQE